MKRIALLVVSNGHGEDLIGARLALAAESNMRSQVGASTRLELQAMPIVGLGAAYLDAGIGLRDPRSEFPSGGLTMHHPRLLAADLRAGIVQFTLRQAAALRRARPDAVLVVGDAYAQALASLVRAPRAVYQPLVSVHQSEGAPRLTPGRLFMDRIRVPELWLMRGAQRLFARDEATAAQLRDRGLTRAAYLGNPMMDALTPPARRPGYPLPAGGTPMVALLPGTRSYSERSLTLMLSALDAWEHGPLSAEIAWSGGERPAPPPGWRASSPDVWHGRTAAVTWRTGSFAAVLATADAVIGTSGTANEQAAGLGLPIVAFPVLPDYGEAFLAGQQRLLGGALEVTAADGVAIAAALRRALHDGARRAEAARIGPERMGPPGASQRIGAALADWLTELAVSRS